MTSWYRSLPSPFIDHLRSDRDIGLGILLVRLAQGASDAALSGAVLPPDDVAPVDHLVTHVPDDH